MIILLQNGLGIENPMFEAFPNHLILSGVSLIGSTYYHGHVKNLGKDFVYLGDFKSKLERSDLSFEKSKNLLKFIKMMIL